MLKFKYLIEAGNFSDITAFETYINKKGIKGYELVQWQVISSNFSTYNQQIQFAQDVLSVLITWKIEIS